MVEWRKEESGGLPEPREQDIEAIKADHAAGIVNAKNEEQPPAQPKAEKWPEDEVIDQEIQEIKGLPIESVPSNLMQGADSIGGQIEILARNGYTAEEIVEAGFSFNSVRTIVSKVKTKYGNKAITKKQEDTGMIKVDKAARGLPNKGKISELQSFVSSVEIPEGDLKTLKEGMQYGMSMMIMAVRVVQELSAIGVQQSKPLLEMAKSMREGEAMASKNSAMEAGFAAAEAVHNTLGPDIAALKTKVDAMDDKRGSGGNPMQNMFVKALEPTIQQLMGSMFKNLPGMSGQQGQAPAQPNTPAQPETNWPIEEQQ